MTPQFKREFRETLAIKGLAPNDHLKLLLACLREHKLIYEVNVINVKDFLTHLNNRGGLLLSPHNAHRNAVKIQAGGGKPSKFVQRPLHGAGGEWPSA